MELNDLAYYATHYINLRGDKVSHKKLQKLLYYIEAWHLVNFDRSILSEDFQAWVHGPVIPALYHKLKDSGFNNLQTINDEFDTEDQEINAIIVRNQLTDEQIELIEEVLDKYGSRSSFELELLSHSETPWREARGNIPPHQRCTNIIPKDKMKEYYSGLD